MEETLKDLLIINLVEHQKISFNVYFVTKGCMVEIEIGEKKNEDCGEIFDLLQEWLGYGEFLDMLSIMAVMVILMVNLFLKIMRFSSCYPLTQETSMKNQKRNISTLRRNYLQKD